MKKIFLLMISLLVFCSVCSAQSMSEKIAQSLYTGESKKIAVILDIPVEYINNEDIKKLVQDKANGIFKAPKFEMLPFDDVQLAKLTYCEEHGIPTFSYKHSANNAALRIYDLKNIGNKLQADYVFYIGLTTSNAIQSEGMFDTSSSATGRCEAKLLDVDNGNYVYQQVLVEEGKSTSWFSDISSPKRAYMDAVKKCIEKIDIDTTKL